ncbi:MAG: DUF4875 domain-containing protein [Oligoflexia bacterium]|nr:DUF4875 domain-containing protein [Oligoflexia bacterium]
MKSKLITHPRKTCSDKMIFAAKTSPRCEDRGFKMQYPSMVLSIFLGLAFMFVQACSDSKPRLLNAKSYEVIGNEDTNFPGRERATYYIVANLDNEDAQTRAETVVKAVFDLHQKHGGDVISVFAVPGKYAIGKGAQYAYVHYSPDNGGFSGEQGWMWDINAVPDKVTEVQKQVMELWFLNVERHRGKDGLLDLKAEKDLKNFIRKKLNLNKDFSIHPYIGLFSNITFELNNGVLVEKKELVKK